MTYNSALIVGAGSGLSASLAHSFAKAGMKVALAARSPAKLAEFATATGARTYNCDAAKRDEVEALFATLDTQGNAPDVVVYNPSYRVRGPLIELDPAARAWLAEKGFDRAFGARPMARRVEKSIKKPLSELLLFGDVKDGWRIVVERKDGGLLASTPPV